MSKINFNSIELANGSDWMQAANKDIAQNYLGEDNDKNTRDNSIEAGIINVIDKIWIELKVEKQCSNHESKRKRRCKKMSQDIDIVLCRENDDIDNNNNKKMSKVEKKPNFKEVDDNQIIDTSYSGWMFIEYTELSYFLLLKQMSQYSRLFILEL